MKFTTHFALVFVVALTTGFTTSEAKSANFAEKIPTSINSNPHADLADYKQILNVFVTAGGYWTCRECLVKIRVYRTGLNFDGFVFVLGSTRFSQQPFGPGCDIDSYNCQHPDAVTQPSGNGRSVTVRSGMLRAQAGVPSTLISTNCTITSLTGTELHIGCR